MVDLKRPIRVLILKLGVFYLIFLSLSLASVFFSQYTIKIQIADSYVNLIRDSILNDNRREVFKSSSQILNQFESIKVFDQNHKNLIKFSNELSTSSNLNIKFERRIFLDPEGKKVFSFIEFEYNPWSAIFITVGLWLLISISAIPLFYKSKKQISIEYKNKIDLTQLQTLELVSKQVSHDIRSPLSVLNAIAGTMVDMPEDKRILLRSASNRINDIANQLLQKNTFEPKIKNVSANTISGIKTEPNKQNFTTELLSSIVDVMVSEKRIQFREKASVVIESELEESYGTFAAIDSIEFKRVLSNLINNSVEALKNENGRVVVAVKNYSSKKIVTVRDNGNGIPQHILEKLGEKGITHGKEGTESGSGLGVYHAKKTVESFGGNFIIQSREGLGTEIRMEFPICETPSWFVPELALKQSQTVVALDDDQSILEVWKQRFGGLIEPVSIVAFTSGNEFNNWIDSNSELTAQTVFLMDYELIGQRFTGLDLIEENKLSDRAILVTSRYEEPQIRKHCEKLGVRLIPKGMAGYVPIEILRNNV